MDVIPLLCLQLVDFRSGMVFDFGQRCAPNKNRYRQNKNNGKICRFSSVPDKIASLWFVFYSYHAFFVCVIAQALV